MEFKPSYARLFLILSEAGIEQLYTLDEKIQASGIKRGITHSQ